MRILKVSKVVPTHFALSNGFDVFDRLFELDETQQYRDRIVKFTKRGEQQL
jgi:hypothetical protein